MEPKKGKISQYLAYLQSSLQTPPKTQSRPPSSSSKKIVLLKKPLTTTHVSENKAFSKTQQAFSLRKTPSQPSYESASNLQSGIVKLRQVPATARLNVATPSSSKRLSPSVSQSLSTKSFLETPAKNEAELVDFLLKELAAVEYELNESVRGSTTDVRKNMSTVGICGKSPRAGFFKAALHSPAFSSEKEREAYLVKELENTNKKLDILECEAQLLRKENEGLKRMLLSNIHEATPLKGSPTKDAQTECMELRRENLRLQEELLLRSSEVYQLILRTAKVNYRMKLKMQNGVEGMRRDISCKSKVKD